MYEECELAFAIGDSESSFVGRTRIGVHTGKGADMLLCPQVLRWIQRGRRPAREAESKNGYGIGKTGVALALFLFAVVPVLICPSIIRFAYS